MPSANWIKETTTTTGTGTVTLVAVADFAEFADAFANGDVVNYVIYDDNGAKEEGRGTVGATKTLARTTIIATLVGGVYDNSSPTAINLSGAATVFMSIASADAFDKYNTSFANSLWRVGATLSGGSTEGHVNLGSGASITANIFSAVIGGNNCEATGANSTALGGDANRSVGTNSVSGTKSALAQGSASVALGQSARATGNNSWAMSKGCDATHLNSAAIMGAAATTASYDVVIGSVNSETASVVNNTIRFVGATGDINIDGAFNTGGAGIGEMVEWADGNPANENRVGLGVSIVKGKIVVGGSRIRGVVSNTCSLVSNNASNKWTGTYLRDKYKKKLFGQYELVEWIDKEEEFSVYKDANGTLYDEHPQPTNIAGVISSKVPPSTASIKLVTLPKVNASFDLSKVDSYKPRSERKEWGIVEVTGQPWVRAAEPITSDYASFNRAGMLVNSTEIAGYPVMSIENDMVQIWLVNN